MKTENWSIETIVAIIDNHKQGEAQRKIEQIIKGDTL